MDGRLLVAILLLVIAGSTLAGTWGQQRRRLEGFDVDNVKSYVINMAKNKDRMVNFDASYKAAKFPHKYTRFEAVDGRNIDISPYVTPKVLSEIKTMDVTGVRLSDKHLTRGMIGCYLSHLEIYKDALMTGVDKAVIFEDDAELDPAMYGRLQAILNKSPGTPEYDIMLLGVICLDCDVPKAGFKRVNNFWGTHGYVITRTAMQAMLATLPIDQQIDWKMSDLIRQRKLSVYAVDPVIVEAGKFGTDVQMTVEEE